MQKHLKYKEEKMFENNPQDISGFGVMNNDAVQINSKLDFGVNQKNEIDDDMLF